MCVRALAAVCCPTRLLSTLSGVHQGLPSSYRVSTLCRTCAASLLPLTRTACMPRAQHNFWYSSPCHHRLHRQQKLPLCHHCLHSQQARRGFPCSTFQCACPPLVAFSCTITPPFAACPMSTSGRQCPFSSLGQAFCSTTRWTTSAARTPPTFMACSPLVSPAFPSLSEHQFQYLPPSTSAAATISTCHPRLQQLPPSASASLISRSCLCLNRGPAESQQHSWQHPQAVHQSPCAPITLCCAPITTCPCECMWVRGCGCQYIRAGGCGCECQCGKVGCVVFRCRSHLQQAQQTSTASFVLRCRGQLHLWREAAT